MVVSAIDYKQMEMTVMHETNHFTSEKIKLLDNGVEKIGVGECFEKCILKQLEKYGILSYKELTKSIEFLKERKHIMDDDLRNLIAKAEYGDVDAMVIVGDCYNKGFLTEKDDQAAYKFYKMAADNGHVKASLMVAIELLYGKGVVKDKKAGISYLQVAADGGVAFGQYMLGIMYKAGEIGFWGREQKAMKYFEMAAKQGDAKSQIELADLILFSKKSKYTLGDMIFWLVCAYLHMLNNEAEEESNAALQRINHHLSNGLPGGKAYVEKIIEDVKQNHQNYIKNPS